MLSLTALRLRPVIQRICCMNKAHRSSRGSISKINQSLLSERIPAKPKRPGNPFILFIKDVESKIYSDKPDASRREVVITAGDMWRDADDNIKKRYADLFQTKNKEFEKQLEAYGKNLTSEQKAAIEEHNELVAEKKRKLNYYKMLKELGKPVRPPSAYGLFLSEHGDKKMLEGETNKTRFARLVEEWKYLEEDKKEAYAERARELLRNFMHDMREWEISMLKKLNVDDDEIDSLIKDDDGKPLQKSKRLSGYIFSKLTDKKKNK